MAQMLVGEMRHNYNTTTVILEGIVENSRRQENVKMNNSSGWLRIWTTSLGRRLSICLFHAYECSGSVGWFWILKRSVCFMDYECHLHCAHIHYIYAGMEMGGIFSWEKQKK